MSSPDLTLLARAEIYALGYIAIPTRLERAGGCAPVSNREPREWRFSLLAMGRRTRIPVMNSIDIMSHKPPGRAAYQDIRGKVRLA
jgi:hypothetical protein